MVPMGPLSILAFCSAIFTSVQAFSLPPALNLLSGASGIKSLVNGTSSNSTNLGARRVFCHASLYGAKLDSTSCRNAWEKMPRSRKEEVFKPRRQGVLYDDATLPIRYLSDDGGCAIDVRFTITRDEQYQRITSNFLTISELAKDLLARCVYTSRSGGEASSEGAYMIKFFPPHYRPSRTKGYIVPFYSQLIGIDIRLHRLSVAHRNRLRQKYGSSC